MHKVVFYALILAALSLAACTQSLHTQAAQESASANEMFYGQIWIHPGMKSHRLLKSGTLYLADNKTGVNPSDALSASSLQRFYGGPLNKRRGSQQKAFYITHGR